MSARPYIGGIPTAPDVDAIRKALGEVAPGTDVAHEMVEKIIGCERGSSRYRTVTTAWRRAELRSRNVEIVAVPKTGFRALLPGERVKHNYGTFRGAVRQQSRAVKRVTMVRDSELDAHDRAKREHMQRAGAAMLDIANKAHREIAPPAPVQQLPRPRLNE